MVDWRSDSDVDSNLSSKDINGHVLLKKKNSFNFK